jgi:hypothetical protein
VHTQEPHLGIFINCQALAWPSTRPALHLSSVSRDAWPAIARQFLERHYAWAVQRLGVYAELPEQADHRAYEALLDVCDMHNDQVAIGQHTAITSAETWGRNFVRNVARGAPWLSSASGKLRGEVVFVCGAGPSLDYAVEFLPELEERGRIFAVSNAAPALVAAGCTPDAVFSCETVDQSAGVRASPNSLHVLDMLAGAANWDAAVNPCAIASHEPNIAEAVCALNGFPFGYSGSVSCAATAAAVALGASTIVLLGQDLGYAQGRMYGAATAHADVAMAEDEAGRLTFTGTSKQKAAAPRLEAPRFRHWTRSAATPPRTTDHTFTGFRGWFEKLAKRRTVINASETGVHIDGAMSVPVRDLVASLPPRHGPGCKPPMPVLEVVDMERVHAVLDDFEMEARQHIESGALMPSAGFPLLNMFVVGSTVAAHHCGNEVDRVQLLREGVREGCEQVIEAVREARDA